MTQTQNTEEDGVEEKRKTESGLGQEPDGGCAERIGARHRPLSAINQSAERWNALTRAVIGCAMRVHSALGPGLPERLYEEALALELSASEIAFKRQREVRVLYNDTAIGSMRLDLLVEDALIIELKAVEEVSRLHLAQLVSYLRAANLPIGLLINFNVTRLRDGIFRRLNDRLFDSRSSILIPKPPPSSSSLPPSSSVFKNG